MTDKVTPTFELAVDGAPIPSDAKEAVIAITCRQDLTMADALEVRLSNHDLRWTEGETFAEGKKLAVKLGYVGGDIQTIVSGEIVRRDCEFPERGPAVVTLVALDREFRLKHGKKSRTFKDVKDSDVVAQLCREAGLSADVEDTKIQHKYLFQVNQTNLEFIRERARRVGYVVQIDRENAKLSFKKPKTGDPKVVTLTWGKDLLSFRPRFSTDGQISQVSVRGFDMVEKKAITVDKDASSVVISTMGGARIGADLAKQGHGKRTVLYPDAPMFSTDEAQQMAEAYANALLHTFSGGEGSCQGSTKIAPDAVVEIDGCGARANGRYFVVAALHHYEPKGYTTFFSFVRPSDTFRPTPTVPPPPLPPRQPDPNAPEPDHFVEVEVVPADPTVNVVGMQYRLTLPDGRERTGTVDESRVIRVEGLKAAGNADFHLELRPEHEAPGAQAGA